MTDDRPMRYPSVRHDHIPDDYWFDIAKDIARTAQLLEQDAPVTVIAITPRPHLALVEEDPDV